MGISGRIAQAFLQSKLTPLVTIASLAVGLLGILATPREEEPQISVPMIDVIAALPGASPTEVENLLARPIEQRMREIPGVDHVYAMTRRRLRDGDRALQGRARTRSAASRGARQARRRRWTRRPPGALPPLVKPHSIDDVPVLTLTLHSRGLRRRTTLRQIAMHLEDEIRTVPDVARDVRDRRASRGRSTSRSTRRGWPRAA